MSNTTKLFVLRHAERETDNWVELDDITSNWMSVSTNLGKIIKEECTYDAIKIFWLGNTIRVNKTAQLIADAIWVTCNNLQIPYEGEHNVIKAENTNYIKSILSDTDHINKIIIGIFSLDDMADPYHIIKDIDPNIDLDDYRNITSNLHMKSYTTYLEWLGYQFKWEEIISSYGQVWWFNIPKL